MAAITLVKPVINPFTNAIARANTRNEILGYLNSDNFFALYFVCKECQQRLKESQHLPRFAEQFKLINSHIEHLAICLKPARLFTTFFSKNNFYDVTTHGKELAVSTLDQFSVFTEDGSFPNRNFAYAVIRGYHLLQQTERFTYYLGLTSILHIFDAVSGEYLGQIDVSEHVLLATVEEWGQGSYKLVPIACHVCKEENITTLVVVLSGFIIQFYNIGKDGKHEFIKDKVIFENAHHLFQPKASFNKNRLLVTFETIECRMGMIFDFVYQMRKRGWHTVKECTAIQQYILNELCVTEDGILQPSKIEPQQQLISAKPFLYRYSGAYLTNPDRFYTMSPIEDADGGAHYESHPRPKSTAKFYKISTVYRRTREAQLVDDKVTTVLIDTPVGIEITKIKEITACFTQHNENWLVFIERPLNPKTNIFVFINAATLRMHCRQASSNAFCQLSKDTFFIANYTDAHCEKVNNQSDKQVVIFNPHMKEKSCFPASKFRYLQVPKQPFPIGSIPHPTLSIQMVCLPSGSVVTQLIPSTKTDFEHCVQIRRQFDKTITVLTKINDEFLIRTLSAQAEEKLKKA